MSALALSVLLSFVSAVAYAGGAIVQEQVAVSSGGQYAPLRRPSWWGALALNGLGGVLHVVALAYGPLSLVQPLGALTIVFALPMAALFVGRRAGATAWRGAIMATVGLAGLLALVGASDTHSLDAAQRVGTALVTGGAVVALMIAGRAAHRHPAVRSVLLATGSGIAFGVSSVFTKTVAVDWTHGVALAELPSLAMIAVFATAGVLLSQASYKGGGLAAPLATLTVVNPVLAAAVGITMFGETFRYGTLGTVLALGCGVVAAGGLILLTTERIGWTGRATGRPATAQPAAGERAGSATVPAPAAGERAGSVTVPAPAAGGEETEAAAVPAPSTGGRGPAAVPREALDAVPQQRPTAENTRTERASGATGAVVADARAEADETGEVGEIGAGVEKLLDEVLGRPVPDGVPPGAVPGAVPDVLPGAVDGRRVVESCLPASYVPFPSDVAVPVPVLDRHRARVRS